MKRFYPPDFVSRDTLAYRLDLRASDIDRMVTAGMLPQPLFVGNEKRWRWTDIEARLVTAETPGDDDPYIKGLGNVTRRTAPLRKNSSLEGA